MEKLEEQAIENLKALWEQFKADNDKLQRKIKSEYKELLSEWQKYKEKIENNALELDEYTNLVGEGKNKKEYLCHFLERKTQKIFGSSKPRGGAHSFMIKRNKPDKDNNDKGYHIAYEKKTKQAFSKTQAEQAYKDKLLPILKKIACADDYEKALKEVNKADYDAKSVLRKIVAFQYPKEFLYIYSVGKIEDIVEQFNYLCSSNEDDKNSCKINEEIDIFYKSHIFRERLGKILIGENDESSENLKKEEDVESILLSHFIWGLLGAKSITNDHSPNVILYGPPGTGKTYSVMQMIKLLCKGDNEQYEHIQFHPSFTYEDFIEGIKPKGVGEDGNIQFELVNGIFKEFCIEVKKLNEKAIEKYKKENPKDELLENLKLKSYFFIVDEINRANLSTVFGETLSLLEKDYRHDVKKDTPTSKENLIKTQYSSMVSKDLAYKWIDGQAYFGVPNNIYFIGMMNDVDKSIDTFDLALRRRFKWIRKDCDYEVITDEILYRNGECFTNIDQYKQCAKNLNNYISEELGLGKSYEFGHSFFMNMSTIAKQKEISQTNLETLFNEYLRPTLKEYLRAFYAENEIEGKLDEALTIFEKPLEKQKKNES